MRICLVVCAVVLSALVTACGGGGGGGDDEPAGPWLALAGGGSIDDAQAAAVFPDGSVAVAGSFRGTAVFGAGESGQRTFTRVGATDAYLAKYDREGALLWVQHIGGTGQEVIQSLAVTSNGKVIVAGFISAGAVYAAGQAEETSVTGSTILLACYDANGALSWARRSTGGQGQGVAVHGDGTVSVTGFFSTSVVLGPGENNETTLTGTNGSLFVARYATATGLLIRGRRDGRAANMLTHRTVGTLDGGIVIAGVFQQSAVFDESLGSEVTVAAGASFGAFLARYDENDDFVWVRTPTSSGARVQFDGIGLLPGGAIAVVGELLDSTATFGPGEGTQTTLTTPRRVATIAVYESNGALRWAKQSAAGTTDSEAQGRAVTSVSGGRIVTTGLFEETQTFGPGEATSDTFTSAGQTDAFLSFHDAATGAHVATTVISGTGFEIGQSLSVFADGELLWAGQFGNNALFPTVSGPQPAAGSLDIFVGRFILKDLLP